MRTIFKDFEKRMGLMLAILFIIVGSATATKVALNNSSTPVRCDELKAEQPFVKPCYVIDYDDCMKLIKKCEGFRAKAYKCSAGILTIGYGTTNNALADLNMELIDDNSVWTEKKSEDVLRQTITLINDRMKSQYGQGWKELKPAVKAALISRAYQVGFYGFRKVFTDKTPLGAAIYDGNNEKVLEALSKFENSKYKNRRSDEHAHAVKGAGYWK